MELSEYEIVWYGEGRVITWGTYPSVGTAHEHIERSAAPLQRWRIVKKVYTLARVETVEEGFAAPAPGGPT